MASNQKQGLDEPAVFRIFLHPIRTVVWAALAFALLFLVASLVMIGMYYDRPTDGLTALREMTETALGYTTIDGDVTRTTELTAHAAVALSNGFAKLFGFSAGIHHLVTGSSVPFTEEPYQRVLSQNLGSVLMLIQTVKLLVVRIALVVASLPLLLLGTSLGAADGLVARAIRRANAGRESSNLYHRAKQLHWVGLVFAIGLFLVAPISINPAWVFLPYAAWAALLSHVQWKYYKKYF
ncbi:DUF4400 domain-containing protein (plasmid) [Burkholderia cenocepacia]|uniref:DUF4400 domain-containing protein n=1 Tax=Burkholderia cenocepacia TaxID=95486 RepID=UPI0020A08F3F|nr:DUF4400 domain-containing protein [Burkholderia cenocepacia]MCO8402797.1 DUF4400 domain-containing protein [Burkholderia cenocepacia]MCO8415036.1 DUF4400 domain-containing protein [Burkholderia cenocepacia]MCO8423068.1 DUF4400 domain-containing protein [Burkholderia cenocepacia]MCO8474783.1 DUF4400 domain-containing protein [Burkholderia cenocepacia]MCO8482037.1 DUF4400 domain-containing protein [Burkholderia cenocepacia]